MIVSSDFSFFNRFKTNFSVFLSIADVNSSNNTNCGFLYKILIRAMICFCPPDKLMPSSPKIVAKPCGKVFINSVKPYSLQKFSMFCGVSSLPNRMFVITLPLKIVMSCGMMPMMFRQSFVLMSFRLY